MTWNILFCLLLFASYTIRGARCLGYIETNFKEFVNFEGKRFDGKCCDKSGFWSWGSSNKCTDECDHTIIICMGNVTQSSSMSACEFGQKELDQVGGNKITFNSHVGTAVNPIKFQFGTWPGVVKVKIDVHDTDGDREYDFVDHYEYQYNTRDLRREIDAPQESLVLTGTRTRFDLELKVYCDLYYYGPQCETYCQETDDETGHYRCDPSTGARICKLGWKDDDCLTNIDDCLGNRCYYGATCIDGINFYSCQCPPGRTGFTCEAEINECASAPCQNGGKCLDASNNFICQCSPGFAGLLCEVEINECRSGPCLNGGACVDQRGAYSCVCKDGFSGDRCQVDLDECLSNPCVSADRCIDLPGDYMCECFLGFTGKSCEHNINECASDPCENGGHCIDKVNSFQCKCQYGFTGELCESRIDYCEPNYCVNGATCSSLETTFECQCTEQFTGLWCELDVNECNDGLDKCSGRGYCVNTHGNYLCVCLAGYEGKNCEIETDECLVTEFPCLNGGLCIDLIGSYSCDCSGTGFSGNKCEKEINECESFPCENAGSCIDQLNGFICYCPSGFTGLTCETTTTTTTTKTPITTTSTHTLPVFTSLNYDLTSTMQVNESLFPTSTSLSSVSISFSSNTKLTTSQSTSSPMNLTTLTSAPETDKQSHTITTLPLVNNVTDTGIVNETHVKIPINDTAVKTLKVNETILVEDKFTTTAYATVEPVKHFNTTEHYPGNTTLTTIMDNITSLARVVTDSTGNMSVFDPVLVTLDRTTTSSNVTEKISSSFISDYAADNNKAASQSTILNMSSTEQFSTSTVANKIRNETDSQWEKLTEIALSSDKFETSKDVFSRNNVSSSKQEYLESLDYTEQETSGQHEYSEELKEMEQISSAESESSEKWNKPNGTSGEYESSEETIEVEHVSSVEYESSDEYKSSRETIEVEHVSSGEYDSSGEASKIEKVSSGYYESSGEIIALENISSGSYKTSGETVEVGHVSSGEYESLTGTIEMEHVSSGEYISSKETIEVENVSSGEYESSGETIEVKNVSSGEYESSGEVIEVKHVSSVEYESSGEKNEVEHVSSGEYESSGTTIEVKNVSSGEYDGDDIEVKQVSSVEYESSGETIEVEHISSGKYGSSRETIEVEHLLSDEYESSGEIFELKNISSGEYESSGDTIDVKQVSSVEYESSGDTIEVEHVSSGEHESSGETIEVEHLSSGEYVSSGETFEVKNKSSSGEYESSGDAIEVKQVLSVEYESSGETIEVEHLSSGEYESSRETIEVGHVSSGEYESSGETFEVKNVSFGEYESSGDTIDVKQVSSVEYESSGEIIEVEHVSSGEHEFSGETIEVEHVSSGEYESSGVTFEVKNVSSSGEYESSGDAIEVKQVLSVEYESSGETIEVEHVSSGEYESSRETIEVGHVSSGEYESSGETFEVKNVSSGKYKSSGDTIDVKQVSSVEYESSGETIEVEHVSSGEHKFSGETTEVEHVSSGEYESSGETFEVKNVSSSGEYESSDDAIEVKQVLSVEYESSGETIEVEHLSSGEYESSRETIEVGHVLSGEYEISEETIEAEHLSSVEYESPVEAIEMEKVSSGEYEYSGDTIEIKHVSSSEYEYSGETIEVEHVLSGEYGSSGETIEVEQVLSGEYESSGETIEVKNVSSGEYESSRETVKVVHVSSEEYESLGETLKSEHFSSGETESSGETIEVQHVSSDKYGSSTEAIEMDHVTSGHYDSMGEAFERDHVSTDVYEFGETMKMEHVTSSAHEFSVGITEMQYSSSGEYESPTETTERDHELSRLYEASGDTFEIEHVSSGDYESSKEIADKENVSSGEYQSLGYVINRLHESSGEYKSPVEVIYIKQISSETFDSSEKVIDDQQVSSGEYKDDIHESKGEVSFLAQTILPGGYESSGEVIVKESISSDEMEMSRESDLEQSPTFSDKKVFPDKYKQAEETTKRNDYGVSYEERVDNTSMVSKITDLYHGSGEATNIEGITISPKSFPESDEITQQQVVNTVSKREDVTRMPSSSVNLAGFKNVTGNNILRWSTTTSLPTGEGKSFSINYTEYNIDSSEDDAFVEFLPDKQVDVQPIDLIVYKNDLKNNITVNETNNKNESELDIHKTDSKGSELFNLTTMTTRSDNIAIFHETELNLDDVSSYQYPITETEDVSTSVISLIQSGNNSISMTTSALNLEETKETLVINNNKMTINFSTDSLPRSIHYLSSTTIPKTRKESTKPVFITSYSTKSQDPDIIPWLAARKHINVPSKSRVRRPKKYPKQPFNPWLAARKHLQKAKSKPRLKTRKTTITTPKHDLTKTTPDVSLIDISTPLPKYFITKQGEVVEMEYEMKTQVTQAITGRNISVVPDVSQLTTDLNEPMASNESYTGKDKSIQNTIESIKLASTKTNGFNSKITNEIKKSVSSHSLLEKSSLLTKTNFESSSSQTHSKLFTYQEYDYSGSVSEIMTDMHKSHLKDYLIQTSPSNVILISTNTAADLSAVDYGIKVTSSTSLKKSAIALLSHIGSYSMSRQSSFHSDIFNFQPLLSSQVTFQSSSSRSIIDVYHAEHTPFISQFDKISSKNVLQRTNPITLPVIEMYTKEYTANESELDEISSLLTETQSLKTTYFGMQYSEKPTSSSLPFFSSEQQLPYTLPLTSSEMQPSYLLPQTSSNIHLSSSMPLTILKIPSSYKHPISFSLQTSLDIRQQYTLSLSSSDVRPSSLFLLTSLDIHLSSSLRSSEMRLSSSLSLVLPSSSSLKASLEIHPSSSLPLTSSEMRPKSSLILTRSDIQPSSLLPRTSLEMRQKSSLTQSRSDIQSSSPLPRTSSEILRLSSQQQTSPEIRILSSSLSLTRSEIFLSSSLSITISDMNPSLLTLTSSEVHLSSSLLLTRSNIQPSSSMQLIRSEIRPSSSLSTSSKIRKTTPLPLSSSEILSSSALPLTSTIATSSETVLQSSVTATIHSISSISTSVKKTSESYIDPKAFKSILLASQPPPPPPPPFPPSLQLPTLTVQSQKQTAIPEHMTPPPSSPSPEVNRTFKAHEKPNNSFGMTDGSDEVEEFDSYTFNPITEKKQYDVTDVKETTSKSLVSSVDFPFQNETLLVQNEEDSKLNLSEIFSKNVTSALERTTPATSSAIAPLSSIVPYTTEAEELLTDKMPSGITKTPSIGEFFTTDNTTLSTEFDIMIYDTNESLSIEESTAKSTDKITQSKIRNTTPFSLSSSEILSSSALPLTSSEITPTVSLPQKSYDKRLTSSLPLTNSEIRLPRSLSLTSSEILPSSSLPLTNSEIRLSRSLSLTSSEIDPSSSLSLTSSEIKQLTLTSSERHSPSSLPLTSSDIQSSSSLPITSSEMQPSFSLPSTSSGMHPSVLLSSTTSKMYHLSSLKSSEIHPSSLLSLKSLEFHPSFSLSLTTSEISPSSLSLLTSSEILTSFSLSLTSFEIQSSSSLPLTKSEMHQSLSLSLTSSEILLASQPPPLPFPPPPQPSSSLLSPFMLHVTDLDKDLTPIPLLQSTLPEFSTETKLLSVKSFKEKPLIAFTKEKHPFTEIQSSKSMNVTKPVSDIFHTEIESTRIHSKTSMKTIATSSETVLQSTITATIHSISSISTSVTKTSESYIDPKALKPTLTIQSQKQTAMPEQMTPPPPSPSPEVNRTSKTHEKPNNSFGMTDGSDEVEEFDSYTFNPITEMFNKEGWSDWFVSFMESSTSLVTSSFYGTTPRITTDNIQYDVTDVKETTSKYMVSSVDFPFQNETLLVQKEEDSKLNIAEIFSKNVTSALERTAPATSSAMAPLSSIIPYTTEAEELLTDKMPSGITKTPSIGEFFTTDNTTLSTESLSIETDKIIQSHRKTTVHEISSSDLSLFTLVKTTSSIANRTVSPSNQTPQPISSELYENVTSTNLSTFEGTTTNGSSISSQPTEYSSPTFENTKKLNGAVSSSTFNSLSVDAKNATTPRTEPYSYPTHTSSISAESRRSTTLESNVSSTTGEIFSKAFTTSSLSESVTSSVPISTSAAVARRRTTLGRSAASSYYKQYSSTAKHDISLVVENSTITTVQTAKTNKPFIRFGKIITNVSEMSRNRSENLIREETTTDTPVFNLATPTTPKLSIIRHKNDLTSNNTYPNPKKETFEYIRNTKVRKGKAKLTFKKIRVTVIRTYEEGKRIVYRTYQKVKDIATTVVVTTYERSRELLEKAIQRVEALWQYCQTGINHYIVKPLLNARVLVKNKFEQTYSRLGEIFNRGKTILKGTADDVRSETYKYFNNLAKYYTDVYRQYSTEVRDIFESLKIPDS